MMLGAVVLVLLSARYFTLDPETFFERQRAVYEDNKVPLVSHIGAMSVATLLGPLQFLRSFRNRHRNIHRLMGRFYIASAIVGGVTGLYMAQMSASGIVSDIGVTLLALGTLVTTAAAFFYIKRGRVQTHREWMTRSYALIFAAVTLRLYLGPLEAVFGEHSGYAIVAWLCWIPNILFAEYLIATTIRRRPEPALGYQATT